MRFLALFSCIFQKKAVPLRVISKLKNIFKMESDV